MAIWSAGVVWHGSKELSARYQVSGLERTFDAPIEAEWGWVLDARPGSIWAEVQRRYAPQEEAIEAPASGPEAWRIALDKLGLDARPPTTPWTGARPRLRFRSGSTSPTLLIGLYGTKSVIYDPHQGVIVPEELPPAETELELVNAREAPW